MPVSVPSPGPALRAPIWTFTNPTTLIMIDDEGPFVASDVTCIYFRLDGTMTVRVKGHGANLYGILDIVAIFLYNRIEDLRSAGNPSLPQVFHDGRFALLEWRRAVALAAQR